MWLGHHKSDFLGILTENDKYFSMSKCQAATVPNSSSFCPYAGSELAPEDSANNPAISGHTGGSVNSSTDKGRPTQYI